MRRAFLLVFLVLVFLLVPARASAADPLRVYYAGPDSRVRTALTLTDAAQLTADPAQANVLVLNDAIPDPAALHARVAGGAGVVLIMGPDVQADQVGQLLGTPVTLTRLDAPLSLDQAGAASAAPISQVQWSSAPQVRDRVRLDGVALTPLAVGYETQETVLGQIQVGQGVVYILTPFLTNDANPQIQDWAYFNYLVYTLAARAAGHIPQSFADYPASPVPHAQDRNLMIGVLALLLLGALILFVLVRRYSQAHPEALDAIVANRRVYAAHERGTDWEEVGFHRPLGGFLLAFMLGLIFFVPLIIYQNLVLPVYILPSAQALGIWGRVTQFFNLAWTLFDMGTSAAFIKYLAEFRVHDPRRGIQYGQLFVWWQMLSGAVQVVLVVVLASVWVPESAYALYAWSIIVHAAIQLPGFYQVMRHALIGLQRSDYAQGLEIGLNVAFPMVVQPVIVTAMFAWGRSNPVFGGPMGGLVGMGMAAYAAELLAFGVGLWLYARLGYGARVLFLAHFDWSIIRTGFGFGVFEMLGSAAWTVGQAAEIWITQTRLINYAEIWGNWVMAQNFVFAFQVLQTLYNNVMPSLSEAISHGRRSLSQYYAAESYRWGGLVSAFVGAVLLAVADRFILGASGPEFTRAATYAVPLIIWGAIQYPSWVGDTVQLADNRPYLKAALIVGEQIVRVVLALLLLSTFQINALIVAYFVGLLMKDFVGYAVNHRVCFPQRLYVWPSLIAPFLAGATHYLFIRWVGGLIWQGDQVTSVVIFLIGILPSYPLFAFLYALFGGWDEGTLEELKRAAGLTGFIRPFAWTFWFFSSLGARVSPLHGRFPIDIRAAALAEAQSLTAERTPL
ncbi:MAG: hypothetical protein WCF84_11480 [Anaerolineae bacterium]